MGGKFNNTSTFGGMIKSNASLGINPLLGSILLVVLLTVGAKVNVNAPGMDVPFTLQSLMLVIGAWLLGPRAALLGSLAYITLGTIGLPVFAGPPYSPTIWTSNSAGFLAAFPLAAWWTGLVGSRTKSGGLKNTLTALAVFLSAHLILLLVGCGWIAYRISLDVGFSVFLQFSPGGVVKSIIGAVLVLLVALFMQNRTKNG